jgi:flagellar P-ring protein precursor FlgI
VTADNIRAAVDIAFGVGAATSLSASTINVRIPETDRGDLVAFIAKLGEVEVQADLPTRVVINERTGTIVVGGEVMIKPCQVAHGSLSIEIAQTPLVSQPLPFSRGGTTVATAVQEVAATEETAYLMPVEGTSAASVASALNRLKVTPRDMIAIFQALRLAGALDADLEIM